MPNISQEVSFHPENGGFSMFSVLLNIAFQTQVASIILITQSVWNLKSNIYFCKIWTEDLIYFFFDPLHTLFVNILIPFQTVLQICRAVYLAHQTISRNLTGCLVYANWKLTYTYIFCIFGWIIYLQIYMINFTGYWFQT